MQRLLIQSGGRLEGFAAIALNSRPHSLGDPGQTGHFKVEVQLSHRVLVQTRQLLFTFDTSDHFINQQVVATVPIDRMNAHGLLGQTATTPSMTLCTALCC